MSVRSLRHTVGGNVSKYDIILRRISEFGSGYWYMMYGLSSKLCEEEYYYFLYSDIGINCY